MIAPPPPQFQHTPKLLRRFMLLRRRIVSSNGTPNQRNVNCYPVNASQVNQKL